MAGHRFMARRIGRAAERISFIVRRDKLALQWLARMAYAASSEQKYLIIPNAPARVKSRLPRLFRLRRGPG